MKKIVILIMLLPAVIANTYYMPDDCADLQACFALMFGGDTLIIRNGTYTGADNSIGPSTHPPRGVSRNQPTIIMAENTGKVFFDGEFSREMFSFWGTAGGYDYMQYWTFEGLQWIRSDGYGVTITGGLTGSGGPDFTTGDYGSSLPDSYLKFKNCGFYGTGNSVRVGGMQHVLFEDCFTWGKGRYGYNLYMSDYIVIRRNVDRRDDMVFSGHHPSTSYINYASHHVEIQNAISIDISNDFWEKDANGASLNDPIGGFYVRTSHLGRFSEDTNYRGDIVLNYDASHPSEHPTRISGWYFQDDPIDISLENCVVWGSSKGIYSNSIPDDIDINHCTVGGAQYETEGTWQYAFGDRHGAYNNFNVINSVAYNNSFLRAAYQVSNHSDYNNFYGNSDDNSNGIEDTYLNPQ